MDHVDRQNSEGLTSETASSNDQVRCIHEEGQRGSGRESGQGFEKSAPSVGKCPTKFSHSFLGQTNLFKGRGRRGRGKTEPLFQSHQGGQSSSLLSLRCGSTKARTGLKHKQ